MTSYVLITTLRSKGLDENGKSIPLAGASFLASERLEVGGLTEFAVTSVETAQFRHPEFTVFEITNQGSVTAGEQTGKDVYGAFVSDPEDVQTQPTTAGANARLSLAVGQTAQVHSDEFGQIPLFIEAVLTPT